MFDSRLKSRLESLYQEVARAAEAKWPESYPSPYGPELLRFQTEVEHFVDIEVSTLIRKHLSAKDSWTWFRVFLRVAFLRGTLRGIAELNKLPKKMVKKSPLDFFGMAVNVEDYWDRYYQLDEPEDPDAILESQGTEYGISSARWREISKLLAKEVSRRAWIFIDDRAIQALKGLSQEIKDGIIEAIQEGVIGGVGAGRISSLLRRKFGLSKARALTIARTETMRAYNRALVAQYRAAGVEGVRLLVEWLTAGDPKVCPFCTQYGGKTYPLEEAEQLVPAHPNCRCVLIPVVLPPK